MKKIVVAICSILVLFLVGCEENANQLGSIFLDDSEYGARIEPDELLYFQDLGMDNFTCTGFTYDFVNNSYWIGDHGTQPGDPICLVQINSDMSSVISCVKIENLCNGEDFNLQGVTYDFVDDMIWCAVGDNIIEVNKEGMIIKELSNWYFLKYQANGIGIDPSDASLWVLCYSEKLVHIDRNGGIIEDFTINYNDQDMIFVDDARIYITIGADYNGENNYLAVFDKQSHMLTFDYRLIKSYAIEGVYKKGGYLYIVNDGLYHKCIIPKSYISVYKID